MVCEIAALRDLPVVGPSGELAREGVADGGDVRDGELAERITANPAARAMDTDDLNGGAASFASSGSSSDNGIIRIGTSCAL